MRLLIFTLSVGFFIWLPSAVADSGGGLSVDAPAHLRQVQNSDNALLTLTVKNIQVHADWHVTSDGDVFTINNDGVLRRKVLATGRHVAKIYAVDRFDRLNSNYANLTASAVITVEFVLGTEFYFANAPPPGLSIPARLSVAVILHQFTVTNGVAPYTYTLVGGNVGEYFALDSASGILSLPQNDQMRTGTYNLRVGVSDSATTPNQATAVVQVNIVPNKFFVMGGTDGNRKNDVWSSVDGITWEETTAAAEWTARQWFVGSAYNGKMYVMGGFSPLSNDVWSSVDGKTWSLEPPPGWVERAQHNVVEHQDRLYVLGGYGGSNRNDVWSWVDGSTWSLVTDDADWADRARHRSVSHNGRLYVTGGLRSIADGNQASDVWSSVDGKTWSLETDDAGWGRRYAHSLVSHNGRLYVLGGERIVGLDAKKVNDVWSSVDGKNWVQEKGDNNDGWAIRWDLQVVSRDSLLYVMGGEGGGSVHKDVWSSADGKSWTKEADAEWPERYAYYAVVFPPPLVLSGTSEVIILSLGTAKPGIATVTAQNGFGEYTYSLESGSGSGIYLNNSSSGVLSYDGTGTVSEEEYLVTVRVEDADGSQAKTIIRVKIE